MKLFIAIMLIVAFALFAVILGCDALKSGTYACYGGYSDHCWEATKADYEDECLAQDRTWTSGTCASVGYSKECDDYWVKPGVECW